MIERQEVIESVHQSLSLDKLKLVCVKHEEDTGTTSVYNCSTSITPSQKYTIKAVTLRQ